MILLSRLRLAPMGSTLFHGSTKVRPQGCCDASSACLDHPRQRRRLLLRVCVCMFVLYVIYAYKTMIYYVLCIYIIYIILYIYICHQCVCAHYPYRNSSIHYTRCPKAPGLNHHLSVGSVAHWINVGIFANIGI